MLLGGDSDGDGIPDDWEIAHGLNPNDEFDALEDPDHDGLTNLEEYQLGTDPHNRDTDGDGLSDGDEVHLYHTNPLLYDTDGDGIGDGLEVQTGSNPLDPASFNLTAALTSIQATPASFRIVSNIALGGGSRQLKVMGQLIDGRTLDVTSRRYGTSYTSSDLLIANFGPEDGRIYAGNNGTATITVSAGGHSSTAAGHGADVLTAGPLLLGDSRLREQRRRGRATTPISRRAPPGCRWWTSRTSAIPSSPAPWPLPELPTTSGWQARSPSSRRNHGLAVIDVSSPANPQVLSYAATQGVATDLAVSGNFVYVADEIGLRVFNVGNPSAPRLAGGLNLPGGRASGVDVSGTLAVVADSAGGVIVIDVSAPSSPRITGRTATRPDGSSEAADLVVRDRLAYVADGADKQLGGLRIVDFNDPTAPVVAGSSNDAFGLTSVAVEKGVALASDFYFADAVPIFQLDGGSPAFSGVIDFTAPPVARVSNGSGLDVLNGVVFMVGASTAGAGYQDNGSSGDGGLFIGLYAPPTDDAGIPPTVAITAPAQGSSLPERSLVLLTADAKDDVQVDSVDFLVNGQRITTLFQPPYQFKYAVPVGVTSLTLTAMALDKGSNATTSDPVTVTVTSNPAPVVHLLAPVLGGTAVMGSQLVLAASATSQRSVARVDFLVNGVVVASAAAAPYQARTSVPLRGSQLTVSAIAYDDFGASAPDSVTVTLVADQPPVAVFLAPRDGDRVVAGSSLLVLGGISDDVGIVQATLLVEGVAGLTLSRPPWAWSTPAPALGATQHLEIRTTDTVGHLTQASITVTGDVDPLTSLHGTVIDPNDQPVAGAQVVENNSGNVATTGGGRPVPHFRGADGLRLTFSHRLRHARGVPYQVQSSTFTPVPGGQVELGRLVLASASSTVTGVILDPANRPVTGAAVVIVAPGPLVLRGTTDGNGRFNLPGVPQDLTVVFQAAEIQGLFTLRPRAASISLSARVTSSISDRSLSRRRSRRPRSRGPSSIRRTSLYREPW